MRGFLRLLLGLLVVGCALTIPGVRRAEAQTCERPFDRFYSPCSGGEIFDDGSAEYYMGYVPGASRKTVVQKFTPSSYPSVYDQVCVAWARDWDAPSSTINYDVVVYDDDGPDGDPGTLLAVVPTAADGVPAINAGYIFSSTPVAVPAITGGSVYIGFRYDPSQEVSFDFPIDTGPSTPQQVIRISSDDGASWSSTPSLGRAVFIRARSTDDYVVVPQSLEYTHGNRSSALLFGVPYTRYQQVFSGAEVGPRWISEIRFRSADGQEDEQLCPELLQGLTITLSTTQKEVDGLSSTFSENVGPDEKVVFDGDIWLQARGSGDHNMPFDIAIPLQEPFYFSGNGNLLLDINTHSASLSSTYLFDFNYDASDAVSRAYCADVPSCPSGDTAFAPDTDGVVTMFLKGAQSIFMDGYEGGGTDAWSSVSN